MAFMKTLFDKPVIVRDLCSNNTLIIPELDRVLTSIIQLSEFETLCSRDSTGITLKLSRQYGAIGNIRLRYMDNVIMNYRGFIVKIDNGTMYIFMSIRSGVMWSYRDLLDEFILKFSDTRYYCQDLDRFADNGHVSVVRFDYRPAYQEWKPFSTLLSNINIINIT